MSRRKPTKLALADGTHRADRHGPAPATEAPATLQALPQPPQGLGAEGVRRWAALGQALIAQGLLTPVDMFSLEHLCKLYDQQAAIEKLLAEKEDGGTRRQLAKVFEEVRRMLDALGCSPTSRPGVPAAAASRDPIGPRMRPPA